LTDTVITGTSPSRPLSLRDERGGVVAGNWQRWLGLAASEDERLLDRAVGPVLDVGCGPGRHLLALARRGVDCLGIDVTPSAVRLARSRGAIVVEGSIFGPVPGAGTWATALLLDGNIGIGGDPVALLARVASVLRPGGRILVELGAPGTGGGYGQARVEHDAITGPWFGWTVVDAPSIDRIASQARLNLTKEWSARGRWFAQVDLAGPSRQ
jgi:SAM-dependent methyltransferase